MVDENQLIRIIERILEERERNALVIIMGGSHYQKELYKILQRFSEVKYQYLMSPAAEAIPLLEIWRQIGSKIERYEQMQLAVQSADCIIIPALTKNSLAKMACGIADNLALCAVQAAFMSGKPVIASDACWNPDSENSKLQGRDKNKEVNKLLYSYRDRLRSFGMISVSVFDMDKFLKLVLSPDTLSYDVSSAEEYTKKESTALSGIVTREDLLGKKQINVTRDSHFTDFAKDYISQSKIKINYR